MVVSNFKSLIREVEDRIRGEFLLYGFAVSEKLLKLYPFLNREMLKALKSKVKCQLKLNGLTCKMLKYQVELNKKTFVSHQYGKSYNFLGNEVPNELFLIPSKNEKRKIRITIKRKQQKLSELRTKS